MKILRNWMVLPRSALALAMGTAPLLGHAAPPPHRSERDTLIAQGNRAVADGKLDEGVNAWSKAWEHEPRDPLLACNIGRADFRRAEYRGAALWLTRCTQLLPRGMSEKEIELLKQCNLELLAAKAQLSILMIEIDEPDTRVVINDKEVLRVPLREDVFVEPGEQRVQAYKGLRTAMATLKTKPGKEYRVALTLPPAPALSIAQPLAPLSVGAPNLAPSWWLHTAPQELFRWWPVVLGIGFTTVSVAGGLGFVAVSNSADAEATDHILTVEENGQTCDGPTVAPRCAAYQDAIEKRDNYSAVATAMFITAGAFVAGTIAYGIYEDHRVKVAARVSGLSATYKW